MPVPALNAQSSPVDEGSVLVGGNANLATTSVDSDASSDDGTTQFALNPTGQYLIVPGVAVGGNMLFGYASNDDFNPSCVLYKKTVMLNPVPDVIWDVIQTRRRSPTDANNLHGLGRSGEIYVREPPVSDRYRCLRAEPPRQ